MASPATTGGQARRWAVPPERTLAWLSLLGLVCYGALWFVHQSFYSVFGVSLATVGVGQAQIVTSAAVVALLLALLVTSLAVIFRLPYTRRPSPWRVALLEGIAGAVLAGVALALLTPLARAARGAKGGPSDVLLTVVFFVVMVSLLGAALAVRGLGDLLIRWCLRWLYQVRKRLLVRRYLGQDVTTEAVIATYLPARRAARRRIARRRARRAAWGRDLRVASRTYRLAGAAVLALAFFVGVFALSLAADHDARARIAGRSYKTNMIYNILTPAAVARPVKVTAQDPRLRSLEKAQLLYLGTHDGMQVLYDRTKKHAVLVPTGSVTLILPD
jgi:hypothetical protein